MMGARAITATLLIGLAIDASGQNYLSRGWQLQDLSNFPDIVRRINKVVSIATGTSWYSRLNVLALYSQNAYNGVKYFAVYLDATETPCRISWTEGWDRNPSEISDISGPSCDFNVYCDDDDSRMIYSAARSGTNKWQRRW